MAGDSRQELDRRRKVQREPRTVESSAEHMAEPSEWLRAEQSIAELSLELRTDTAARGRNRSRAVVEGNRTC